MAKEKKKQAQKTPPQPRKEQSTTILLATLILICVAAALPYLFSLGGQFVLDDKPLVLGDPDIRSLSGIAGAFTRPFASVTPYYRPLITSSLIINYAMFGKSPLGYKATNVLLHILVTLLVFVFVRRLLGKGPAPTLAALIFAVHPAHTESVAWISGRTDLIAAAVGLTSLIAYAKAKAENNRGWYYVSVVFFLLSLLSKESMVIIPVFMVGIALLQPQRPKIRQIMTDLLPMLALLAAYVALRQIILGHIDAVKTPLPFRQRIILAPTAVIEYIKLLIIPARAEPVYDVFLPALEAPVLIAAAWIGTVVLAAAAFVARKRSPVASFAAFWTLIALAPVIDIIPLPWSVVNQRFLYLPSVGFVILFGMALSWFVSIRPKPLADIWPLASGLAVGGFLILSAVQTYAGAPLWMSNIGLANRMLEAAPNIVGVHGCAGEAFKDHGDFARAAKEYEIVAASTPDDVPTHSMLVLLYSKLGNKEAAIREARVLTKLTPKDPAVHNDLGRLLAANGDVKGAVKSFETAVKLAPKNPTPRFNLAKACAAAKNYGQAVYHYQEGLKLEPDNERARYELGMALRNDGKPDEAEKELSVVVKAGGKYAAHARKVLDSMNGRQ